MIPSLFKAGGALVSSDASVYVERQADRDALVHLRAMNYLLIIEPRQQGKTSLVNHLVRHSVQGGIDVVYADVTTPDRSSEEAWYHALCSRLLRQLRIKIPHNQPPAIPTTASGWREFLSDIAILAVGAHRNVVVALDEIGAVDFPGATGFFSVLRDIFNSRRS